jgi:hypothetical protein
MHRTQVARLYDGGREPSALRLALGRRRLKVFARELLESHMFMHVPHLRVTVERQPRPRRRASRRRARPRSRTRAPDPEPEEPAFVASARVSGLPP